MYGYGGAAAGHEPFGGGYGLAGGPINNHPTYAVGQQADPLLRVPINYVDADGSAHTYNMNHLSYLDTTEWVTAYNYDYLLPKDLAMFKKATCRLTKI